MLIVDASVAAKWFLAEPDSAAALALRDSGTLHAPSLLVSEIGNVLRSAVAQRRLPAMLAEQSLAWLIQDRAVNFADDHELALPALRIALALNHSVYDCLYLALSEKTGFPVVTADRRLMAALGKVPAFARRVVSLPQA